MELALLPRGKNAYEEKTYGTTSTYALYSDRLALIIIAHSPLPVKAHGTKNVFSEGGFFKLGFSGVFLRML